VYRQQLLNCFQLQDDSILYDQIDLVTAVQLQAFVLNRKCDLAPEIQSPQMKLMAQALFVCRL